MLARPEWGIATAMIFSLAKELPGSGLLTAGAAGAAGVGLILRALRRDHSLRVTASPLIVAILPAVLGLRLLVSEEGVGAVGALTLPQWLIFLVNAALVVISAAVMSARPIQTMRALGVASLILIGLLLPDAIAGIGSRSYGVTGNPNRTVLALVIAAPLAMGMVGRFPVRGRSLLAFFVAVASLVVAVGTGSAQALVAVPLTLGLTLIAAWKARGRALGPSVVLSAIAGSFAAGFLLFQAVGDRFVARSGDLSGRLPIFSRAWDEYMENWMFGTGERSLDQVSGAAAVHNTFLGILTTGGTFAGMLLILATGALAIQTSRLYRDGSVLIACAGGLVAEFLVQTAEGVPAVWIVLGVIAAGVVPEVGQVSAGASAKGFDTGAAAR